MSRRMERIQELIREELSELLMHEMNDPRLDGLISITRVEITPDLLTARVFVSVMSETANPDDAIKALSAASGFLHRELKQRIRELRRVPFLSFRLDTSISEGAAILSHIDQALREDSAAHPDQ